MEDVINANVMATLIFVTKQQAIAQPLVNIIPPGLTVNGVKRNSGVTQRVTSPNKNVKVRDI